MVESHAYKKLNLKENKPVNREPAFGFCEKHFIAYPQGQKCFYCEVEKA